jgi:signal transduction histidine kinase
LARSVSRPLVRLRHAAAVLGSGDLTARVDAGDGPREVRELATMFNAMSAQLEHLVHAQEEFVADASHQLRTPLQALRLRLENAEAELGGGRVHDDLMAASDEAARLGRIVESLLALARTERQPAARGRIDIGAVVAERGATWTPIARERGVSIALPSGHRKHWALATPGHLEQVLDNVIANAIDASPDGSTIAIRVTSVDGAIEIHVIDEGPGLTADQRMQALDRFWRAPGAKTGGSGLGLTIAKRLLAVDGGGLELRAAPRHGIDAVVTLQMTV